MAKPLLDIRAVTRRFGGLVAVSEATFSVAAGEIFGLIGPNGAGKTTLFNMISGLIAPSEGEIIYDATPITAMPAYRIARQGIGRTFQNIRLFSDLSVLKNIQIGQHIHEQSNTLAQMFGLKRARHEARLFQQHCYELLELVGLDQRAHETAGNLAYGDQRRLEIARALALQPRLLLLDEPAAGMNINEKQTLSDFIRQLRARFDLTIVLIEHHVPLVMGLCDRIAVLDFGKVIALGKPEHVRHDPAVIEAYLGDE